MGLPIGQKLVKSGSTWVILCGTHISETAGWIYTIQSSMELSRPVVAQHHGHLTLTLDFQGQIFKMLYLRNGRADRHGAKGMWVDRIYDLDPWFSRSNIEKVIPQGWDARLTWKERDVSGLNVGPTLRLSTLTSLMTLTLNFQRQILN